MKKYNNVCISDTDNGWILEGYPNSFSETDIENILKDANNFQEALKILMFMKEQKLSLKNKAIITNFLEQYK